MYVIEWWSGKGGWKNLTQTHADGWGGGQSKLAKNTPFLDVKSGGLRLRIVNRPSKLLSQAKRAYRLNNYIEVVIMIIKAPD